MEMRFEHLFDISLRVGQPQDVGALREGQRIIAPVLEGKFSGPRLKGEVLPGGADWLVLNQDVARLDVRITLRTEDGALIYMTYGGVLRPFSHVMAHMVRGESPPAGSYYWYVTPRFETGNQNYAWLNDVVAVGVGAIGPGGTVDYSVYAMT